MVLLATSLGISVMQLIALVQLNWKLDLDNVLIALGLLAALGITALILRMPLRSPDLSSEAISPALTAPTSRLRSPEDNLTPWQFMTVSWMWPLVSLGKKRQLNDEDVWSLGHEFQHTLLHNAFRGLPGSVTRRLLSANGLDLIIISVLGLLELVASIAHLPTSF